MLRAKSGRRAPMRRSPPGAQRRLGQAEQAHFRQREDLRPLRHHPDAAGAGHLSEAETKLYDMVMKRFLAVFFPAAEFLVTTRITRVEGEPFRTDGRVMVKPAGSRSTAGKPRMTTPTLAPARRPRDRDRDRGQGQPDQPPARFTEATLLSAMEGAGKLVEDEELREAMSEQGPGHAGDPRRGHRGPDLRGLRPSQRPRTAAARPRRSRSYVRVKHFGIDEITSPELTGDWEYKLKQMEHGHLRRDDFMGHIVEPTREMVGRIKGGELRGNLSGTSRRPVPGAAA